MFLVCLRCGLLFTIWLAVVFAAAGCGSEEEEAEPTDFPAVATSAKPRLTPTARIEPTTQAPAASADLSIPKPEPTPASPPVSSIDTPTPSPMATPAPSLERESRGFGAMFDINGKSYEIWCPEGGSTPPYLTNQLGSRGLELNCVEQLLGSTGLTVSLVILDVTVLDGPFELTGPDTSRSVPIVLGVNLLAANTTDSQTRLTTRNRNIQSINVKGKWDGGTGRVIGTFEASFKATNLTIEGEGSISGTFDLEIPSR